MDSDNVISLPKGDPDIAQMFSSCAPGDKIDVTLGYQGKTAKLSITVGEDNADYVTGTVDEVSTQDAGKDAENADEEAGEPPAGGGAAGAMDDESDPAAYITKKRKGAK